MKELEIAKQQLIEHDYTCVIRKGEDMHYSTFRGVKPLVQWLDQKLDAKDAYAADKVVGRATAFLYVLLGVKAVYAHVISRPALAVLENNQILVQYGTLVDNIINRKGTGICPFEETVLNITEPEAAYRAIRQKMIEMNIQ